MTRVEMGAPLVEDLPLAGIDDRPTPSPSANPASQYAPAFSWVRSATKNRAIRISTPRRSSISPAGGSSSTRKSSKPATLAPRLKAAKTRSRPGCPKGIAMKPVRLSRRSRRSSSRRRQPSNDSDTSWGPRAPWLMSPVSKPVSRAWMSSHLRFASVSAPTMARWFTDHTPMECPGASNVRPSQRMRLSSALLASAASCSRPAPGSCIRRDAAALLLGAVVAGGGDSPALRSQCLPGSRLALSRSR